MITKISYTFTDEDPPEDIQTIQNAIELRRAIEEYADWLRSNDKYGDGTPVPFDEIRTHFWEFMSERGVSRLIG